MQLTICINATGFHPAAWRLSGGGEVLSAARFRSLTMLAESAGFGAALFGLSLLDPVARSSGRVAAVLPDALPLASSLVAHTRGLGLGTAYSLERAEPHNIARSFATLDRMSIGRSAWIIELPGGGDHAREAECIEVVRELWDSWEDGAFVADQAKGWVADSDKVHRINHAGPHFMVRGPLNVPRPNQGHPVLIVMDPGDAAGRALAASVADLLIVHAGDGDAARIIRQAARSAAAPRNPDDVKVLMSVFPVLGATEAEARRRDAELRGLLDPALLDFARHRLGLKFVGTPQQLCDRLADLHASQACDGFNIVPPVLPDDLPLFAEHVVPLLKRKNLIPAQWPSGTLRERIGLRHPRSRYAKDPASA